MDKSLVIPTSPCQGRRWALPLIRGSWRGFDFVFFAIFVDNFFFWVYVYQVRETHSTRLITRGTS